MQPLKNELVWVKFSDIKWDTSIWIIFSTLGSDSESKKCSMLVWDSLKYILISESAAIVKFSSIETLFCPLSI